MRVRDALRDAARQLAAHGPDPAAAPLEAEVLLAHVLDAQRSFLYANPELDLPEVRAEAFRRLARRRARGEPVAYLVGRREFWSLDLEVTPDVLIPRADTETLVEAALERLPKGSTARVADLGTGSGAIVLALKSERPRLDAWATDLSEAALAVARRNAARLGTDIHFVNGPWFEPLEGRFELIASNPPYVAANDPHLAHGDCRFEPAAALASGADGLDALRELAAGAPAHLAPGGWLLLEHGPEQGSVVRELLTRAGLGAVDTRRDLEQRERVTLGQLPR